MKSDISSTIELLDARICTITQKDTTVKIPSKSGVLASGFQARHGEFIAFTKSAYTVVQSWHYNLAQNTLKMLCEFEFRPIYQYDYDRDYDSGEY